MLTDSRILITGAKGFVGTHLAPVLTLGGARLTQWIRPGSLTVFDCEVYNKIDLSDRKQVSNAISSLKPNFVVHLAASKVRSNIACDFIDNYCANISMATNLINSCRDLSSFQKFIFLGSCDEYGSISCPFKESQREDPSNAYGLAKLAITKMLGALAHTEKFPSIVLRPSVIYGPRQGTEMFLSALIQALVAGEDFAMTAGDQYRDFVYVDDVVTAIILALNADEALNGRVFNIGSGKSQKVNDIAALVAAQVGNPALAHIKFGAKPYRLNEVMDYSVDITQARYELGWQPNPSLESGLQKTINYFKSVSSREF